MNASYNHRPLHSTASALQSAGTGGPSNPRIADLLDFVRQEFDLVATDAHAIKVQNNEFETHSHQHLKEMQALKHNFMDLEREHLKIKEQYEEEIMRLRRDLEAAQQQQHGAAAPSHPPQHTLPPPQSQPSQAPAHQSPRPNRSGSGSTPAPPQVGHGPANLFGGIMAGGNQPSGSQSATAPSRDFPPMNTEQQHQAPATARENYSNGWDRSRDREHVDHPAKRMRNDEPAAPYAGTPPAGYGIKNPSNGQPQPHLQRGQLPSIAQPAPAPPTPSEMNPETIPKELKKEGGDWITMYNPKVKKTLDVELVHTLVHDSVVCCVRFSPNGKILATGCNRNTNLYDTKTGAKQCSLAEEVPGPKEDNYIRAACFSPDGKFIATGSEDRTIRIWDIANKRVRHAFHGHRSEIYSLAFSPDGRFLMSGSGDKSARVWDMDTGGERYNLVVEDNPTEGAPVDAGVTSVAVSPDGKLLAAGSLDTIVRLWDATTGALLDKLRGHRDSVYSVAFSPDGQWLVSGSLDKTLKIWDLQPLKASLASGGNGVGTTSSVPGNGTQTAENAGDVKKEGDVAMGGTEEGGAKAGCMATLTGHKDYVLSVAVSPDGNWIVSGSKDRGVSFWDPKATSAAVVLQGHKNSVISIAVSEAISEGSGLLATGSGDWSCRIWKYSPIKP